MIEDPELWGKMLKQGAQASSSRPKQLCSLRSKLSYERVIHLRRLQEGEFENGCGFLQIFLLFFILYLFYVAFFITKAIPIETPCTSRILDSSVQVTSKQHALALLIVAHAKLESY